MKKVNRLLSKIIVFITSLVLLTQSTLGPTSNDVYNLARFYTRTNEFDYLTWTFEALIIKNIQAAVKAPQYMTVDDQRRVVFEYMRLVRWIDETSGQIDQIYADPNITQPRQVSAELSERLRVLRSMEDNLKPIAESVLQYQVSTVIAEMGLGAGGQPTPPVLYSVTRLPNALIISPRTSIREDADISLRPDMTFEEIDQVENNVSKNLDVSALVVPVGGIGIYPTMVMSTTDLPWLLETVSHEWTHNFLTLHPLGVRYMDSPEMRTINETTANISGKEIGQVVLQRYYPELAPEPELAPQATQPPSQPKPTPAPDDPNVFRFNREMHKTRVQVDALLKAGKVQEAEDYMEARRRVFWEHGYQIRKLNQAYFAFYGAYNDVPGGVGAAGADPVGPAVQALRARSKSLAEFLNQIAWVQSFKDLKKLVEP